MQKFSQQFHKESQNTVNLKVSERDFLRERIESYMEYHPLPTKTTKTTELNIIADKFASEKYFNLKIPFQTFFKFSLVSSIILLLIIPFVAEQSVPGDVLYTVKVNLNEEVRSALTFNNYQKIEWETERLNRRIAEVRLLSSEGKLTEEIEAQMAIAVKNHTDSAKREIETLSKVDIDEAVMASIALDTTLVVQTVSLREETEGDLNEVLNKKENQIVTAIEVSRDQSTEVNNITLPSVDKLLARIEQNTTRIHELQNNLISNQSISETDFSNVKRRIEDLDREIALVAENNNFDDIEVSQKLLEILQKTQKLIVYMTNLSLIETIDIEEIIPLVPTDTEKQTQLNEISSEIIDKINIIDDLLELVIDIDVRNKANYSLVILNERYSQIDISINNYESFIKLANEDMILADDTITFLEKHIDLTTNKIESNNTTEPNITTVEKETEELNEDVNRDQDSNSNDDNANDF